MKHPRDEFGYFAEVPRRRVRMMLEFDSNEALPFLRRVREVTVRDYDGLPTIIAVRHGRGCGNIRKVSVSEVAQ